jgi:hypothetical protein
VVGWLVGWSVVMVRVKCSVGMRVRDGWLADCDYLKLQLLTLHDHDDDQDDVAAEFT